MNELDRLFDGYAECSLSPEDEATLCAWLRQDVEHIDQFVRESFLHSQLFVIARQRMLDADVAKSPAQHQSDPLWRCSRNSQSELASGKNLSLQRANRWIVALAASLLFMAVWAIWSSSRRPAVGQLNQTTANVTWRNRSDAIKAGDFLFEGQELVLDRGRVLATLASGARIVLEGPAVLRVIDRNRVHLTSGRIGATAPTQAIGFVVETPIGEFVDLGTEFNLDLKPDGTCRLFVFTGLVEVKPRSGERANPPFQVAQTQAVSYDSNTDRAKLISVGDEVKLSL